MAKKRMMSIGCVAFIFAIILFTALFLSILHPELNLESDPTVGGATPPSSYTDFFYGDLSSLALIVAMISVVIYAILKA